MIITVVSFKGGVGKTTTAVHLVAYFQKLGRSVLLDGDPNRSASAWEKRGAGKLGIDIVDEMMAFTVSNEVKHCIIDTAARPDARVLKALSEKVHLIIIPTTTDGLSLDALSKTIDALRDVEAAKFRVLLTMVPPKPRRDGERAREILEQAGLPVFKAGIRRLSAFEKAGTLGVLVSDVKDERAALGWEDYAAVGAEVKAIGKKLGVV
jgi:chromosome partitioning protein